MDAEQFKKYEKTFLLSKKFLAFFLITGVLAGQNIFLIWKMTALTDIGMWPAIVMTTNIVATAFVGLAFNVKQAALDSAVRLASILGDKFPAGKIPPTFP